MARPYSIQLTPEAEETYRDIARRARKPAAEGDHANTRVKMLRLVDELIDKIIPHDPFDTSRALSGDLKGIFRVKKGRLRICYVGSSVDRVITILYIADQPRKAGDKNDPYAILTKLVGSGRFDEFYKALGLPQPEPAAASASASSLFQ